VEVRPADILKSAWDSILEGEPNPKGLRAVRLGLRQIKGLIQAEAERLVAAREGGARDMRELAAQAGLSRGTLERLAEADTLKAVAPGRREGLWAVKALEPAQPPLLALMGAPPETPVTLPPMSAGAHVAEDYRTTRLSLKGHPIAFFRDRLDQMGATPAKALRGISDGRRLSVAGLVLVRQRPGTAKGVVFITLEDETGSANAVVWPNIFAANRATVMSARFLVVHGRLQRAVDVIHVVAERFTDLTGRLGALKTGPAVDEARASPPPPLGRSRDFH
jgi:error-prone DNA polymerase